MPLVSLLSLYFIKQGSLYAYTVFSCLWDSAVTLVALYIAVSYVFPPLAPFPYGLVSLPQIERIQSFQESVKGQEEIQVP